MSKKRKSSEENSKKCSYHLCENRGKLYKCKYCGKYFCKEHIKPGLAMTRGSIELIKDPILKERLYEEWRRNDVHPDIKWTKIFFQNLKDAEEKRRDILFDILDSSSTVVNRSSLTTRERSSGDKTTSSENNFEHGKRSEEGKLKTSILLFLNEVFSQIKNVRNFIKHILIVLTLLCFVHIVLTNKVNFFNLFFRSVSIVLIFYAIKTFYDKTKNIFPYEWLMFFVFVIILAGYISTGKFSIPTSFLDLFFGINNFSEIISTKLTYMEKENIRIPESLLDIGKSLVEFNNVENDLKVKVYELRNNSRVLELRIHELINEERKKRNLSVLYWDEHLAEIARAHSKDMGIRGYFSHVSPEGEDVSSRYKKFNYVCRIVVGNTIYSGGENLLLTYVYKSYYYDPLTGKITRYVFSSLEDIAMDAVDGWMSSKGHRDNILNRFFTREGIGVYVTEEGKIYITQNFC